MPPTLDFAGLSLKDALDLAILIEEEAKERYEEFYENLAVHHTPDAAQFFKTMAGNEAKHGEDLTMRRQSLFPGAPTTVTRAMLWDVEAPDYDASRMFMTARQAMEVAMACEVKAHDFFDAALAHVTDAEVRALFEELREEESEHKQMVQAILDRMPPASADDAEADFGDEPVAQ
jgi:erythrin-vacuolar iron transport family protein